MRAAFWPFDRVLTPRLPLPWTVVALLVSSPALASTMPGAVPPAGARLGTGFGTGISVSLDSSLGPSWQGGIAMGTADLGVWGAQSLLIRGGYLLPMPISRLRLAVLAETGWRWLESARGAGYTSDHLDLGLGLEYPLLDHLKARMNLAARLAGPDTRPPLSSTLAGVELAWSLTRHAEVTFGSNGFGNVVGLKLDL